jgi:hypothetical protein
VPHGEIANSASTVRVIFRVPPGLLLHLAISNTSLALLVACTLHWLGLSPFSSDPTGFIQKPSLSALNPSNHTAGERFRNAGAASANENEERCRHILAFSRSLRNRSEFKKGIRA